MEGQYAGMKLTRRQLIETGRFSAYKLRSIFPNQRLKDKDGNWWCAIGNTGERAAWEFVGLEFEDDNVHRYI